MPRRRKKNDKKDATLSRESDARAMASCYVSPKYLSTCYAVPKGARLVYAACGRSKWSKYFCGPLNAARADFVLTIIFHFESADAGALSQSYSTFSKYEKARRMYMRRA